MEILAYNWYEADRATRLDRILTLREGVVSTEGPRISLIKKLESGVGQVLITLDKPSTIKGFNHIAFSLWCDLKECGCASTANEIVVEHFRENVEAGDRILQSL